MMLIIVITCIGAVSLCGAALVHMHVYRNFPTSIHPSIHPSSLLSLLSFYLLNKYSVGSRSLLDWQPLRTPQKSLFLSHSGPLLAELSLHLWPSWTSPFFGPFSIFTSPSLCLYFSPRLHVSVLVYPLVFFFCFLFFFLKERLILSPFSCIPQSAKTHICTEWFGRGVMKCCRARGNDIFSSADLFIGVLSCLCVIFFFFFLVFVSLCVCSVCVHSRAIFFLLICHLLICFSPVQ